MSAQQVRKQVWFYGGLGSSDLFMRLRSFYFILGAIATTFLAISAAGYLWLVAQSPLSLLQEGYLANPGAAAFVPRQSPVMVSLLVNPDRLEALRVALTAPSRRRAARRELDQFKQSVLAERQLDYDIDIKPWLGDEMTVAVTTPDLDRDARNGLQPGYLLALETTDGDRARDFLQLFWQKQAIAGIDLIFEPFAGVKLVYGRATADTLATLPSRRSRRAPVESEPEPTNDVVQTLASTVVGDRFVLFANSPKVLREALNNFQAPGLNLSSNKAYLAALDDLPLRSFGVAYLNLEQLNTWLAGLGDRSTADTQPSKNQAGFDQLLAGLQLSRQGVLLDTRLLAKVGTELIPRSPNVLQATDTLNLVPADTPLLAYGTNLQQLFPELMSGLASIPVFADLVQQPLSALEDQWRISFDEDIFAWVDEEFALGFVPETSKSADWIFVADANATTNTALERLDAIAQAKGLSIGPVDIDDNLTYTWTRLSPVESSRRSRTPITTLQADVQGVHGTVAQHEIFATSIEAIRRSLKAPGNALVDQASFQQAIAPIPSENEGYLYVDWQAVRPILEARLPLLKFAELTARPLFDHIETLTFSSLGGDRQTRRGALFICLNDG